MHLSLPPENIRILQGLLMLSGGKERLHRERMGLHAQKHEKKL